MNICKYCNRETKNPSFCSASCAASFNNRNITRNKTGIKYTDPDKYKQMIYLRTLGYGYGSIAKKLHLKETTVRNNCKHIYSEKSYILSKERFEISIYNINTLSTNKTIKELLIKNYGHECMICGLTKWNNKLISLELDHIDGNNENNELKNLRIICPNCHSQTPTWRRKKSSLK